MKCAHALTNKYAVLILFTAMVGVNFLANTLPINGVTTGALSDLYVNLFTPAGLTFSIWGLIYLLLGGFAVYQFKKEGAVISKLRQYFVLTSLINIAWIFAWHYQVIWLSLVIMVTFLGLLIKTSAILRKENYVGADYLWLKLPFSIYFGWISVATIANFTVFFVDIGWNRFGLTEVFWVIAILIIGWLIGIARALYDKNLAYLGVFIWAYIGILIKHTSLLEFARTHPAVITTLYILISGYILVALFIATKKHSGTKRFEK